MYGISVVMNGMDSVAVLSQLAIDWIWIDAEHEPLSMRDVREVMAVIPEDTAGLVRIPGTNPKEVEQVFDAGADGVIVPKLHTIEQVQSFVDSAYYPPEGDRGVARSPVSDFDRNFSKSYMQQTNERAFVVIEIETTLATQIEEVAQIDGVDCLFIEPSDLSAELGNPLNPKTIEYHDVAMQILRACKRHNVAPGYLVVDNDIRPFVEDGWQVLSIGTDAELLTSGFQTRLNRTF